MALGTLLDSFDASNSQLTGQVQTLSDQHKADSATIQQLNNQITVNQDVATAQIKTLNGTVISLNAQLVAAPFATLATATAYSGMHMWPAKTTDAKEVLGLWIDSGGHTAQSNPSTSTTPHGTFTWTPGTFTTPARIVFNPAAGWDDIYIYERFPLPAALPTIMIDRRTFSLTPADRAVINCIEWQQELTWNGKTYNLGWQWNFGKKVFNYFDYTTKNWIPAPNVPFVDLGATPIPVSTTHFLNEANGTITHHSIVINGVEHVIDVTVPATPTTSTTNKYTVSMLQMDSDGKGDTFGVNIHDVQAISLIPASS